MGVGGSRHNTPTLPPGKGPGIHCMGRWVEPRAGLDGCGKSCRHRDSMLEHPVSLFAIFISACAFCTKFPVVLHTKSLTLPFLH
jgi:hypothetical protein